jgi:membrane protease YdiL (CAAX protease family)
MQLADHVLREEFIALFWSVVLGVVITWVAAQWGFFTLGGEPQRALPLGRHVAVGFILFVAILWGAMGLALLWSNPIGPPIIHLLGGLFAALIVGAYAIWGTPVWMLWASPSVGQTAVVWLRGVLSWLVAFPWVIVVAKLCMLAELWWSGSTGQNQLAVTYLTALQGHPVLLWASMIVVVVVSPFVEELLFRGLLHSWLRRYLPARWAITVAALIFALCHYAPQQGVANLEIVLSLALLGGFLGFLLEKYNSLWAPYGLHMAFNAVGAAMALSGG